MKDGKKERKWRNKTQIQSVIRFVRRIAKDLRIRVGVGTPIDKSHSWGFNVIREWMLK